MAIKKTASKGAPIEMPPPDDGLSPETLGGVRMKPHYFELSLRSVSHGVLNQGCPLVREYAWTSGELAFKEMEFAKHATVPVANAVLGATNKMSMPFQAQGIKELKALAAELGMELDPGDGK